MEITGLFLIGFLGSLHCIGMCGPIILAIPVSDKYDIIKKLLYNLGRVVTYSIMGIAAGFIGNRFFAAGLQQDVSIISGALIIVYVLIPPSLKGKIGSSGFISSLYSPIRKTIGKLFKQKTMPAYFAIGVLNGFLPCGFVYVALAASAVTGSVLNGALAMALFGLGTIPALFIFSIAGKFFTTGIRNKIKKFMPAFALILGVIFILRGLNLGIPMLSPKVSGNIHAVTDSGCCN